MIKKGDNVCFVVPPFKHKTIIRDYAGGLGFEANSGYILPPLNLLQLAACIDDVFNVSVIDAHAEKIYLDELSLRLVKKNIKVVIIELSVPTLESDLSCAKMIAESDIKVVGKLYIKNEQILTRILKDGFISSCIITECEDNLSSILLGKDISGTASWNNGSLSICHKSLVQDLNNIPFPKRELVLNNVYNYPKLGECTTVLSSRGCPYSCKYYCPYPIVQGDKWRARKSSNVIEELKEIKRIGIERVLFRDPVFSLDIKRIEEICKSIISNKLTFEWWCETRADRLPNDLIEIMAQANCKGINIGVESGDSHLRFSLLKRGVPDSDLLRIVKKGKEVGIKICFLLMIGFPGETRYSVLKTAILLRKCRPFSIGIGFPVHHPDTQLDNDARQNGWIIIDDYSATDGSVPVLAGDGLNVEEMKAGKGFLEKLFQAISVKNSSEEDQVFQEINLWVNNI